MEPTDGDRPSTSPRTRRRWTLAVFGFVALEGAGLQMRGAVVPVLREAFGVTAWQLGLVAPAGTVGFVLLVAAVGAVAGRFEAHRLFLVGVLGTGAGLLAAGPGLVVGLFAVGFTLSGLFPTLTAHATDAVPEHSALLNAVALVTAAAGIAGVPVLMGFVVDTSGIVPAMRLLLVPLVVMVLVLGVLSVRGTGTRAES